MLTKRDLLRSAALAALIAATKAVPAKVDRSATDVGEFGTNEMKGSGVMTEPSHEEDFLAHARRDRRYRRQCPTRTSFDRLEKAEADAKERRLG